MILFARGELAGCGGLDFGVLDSGVLGRGGLDSNVRVGAIGKSLDSALWIDSSAESKRGFWIKLLKF